MPYGQSPGPSSRGYAVQGNLPPYQGSPGTHTPAGMHRTMDATSPGTIYERYPMHNDDFGGMRTPSMNHHSNMNGMNGHRPMSGHSAMTPSTLPGFEPRPDFNP